MEPARIGAILCVQPLAMAAIAAFSGAISDRIGTRWPATIGLGIQAVGLFVLSSLAANSPISLAVLGLALAGFGIGMFVSPNNSAMMGAAPKERRGIASGVMATSRNVGMVLGIGMAGAIYTSILGSAEHGSHPPVGMVVSGVHYGLLAAGVTAILGAISAYARE
jgi:MFS family permease